MRRWTGEQEQVIIDSEHRQNSSSVTGFYQWEKIDCRRSTSGDDRCLFYDSKYEESKNFHKIHAQHVLRENLKIRGIRNGFDFLIFVESIRIDWMKFTRKFRKRRK